MYQEIIKMCRELTVSVGIQFLMFRRNAWNRLLSDAPSYINNRIFDHTAVKISNLHRKVFEIFYLMCLIHITVWYGKAN